jgi:hypothetical protein
MTFSTTTTTILFTCGAAVLAIWTIARFPDGGPRGIGRCFLHAVAAFGIAALVPHAIELVRELVGRGAILVATLLVILPALLYMFLATLWLFRALQDMAGLRRF